ncbi:hypothetical protein EDD27_1458 [Nonomuraea polychroma]|uniref:Site-specific recombinase XerD n=1 Tax=Nonomuraea polychroma TaxID=46176 RepID=A0A438LZZ8_9ACTN|nr:hypothetical protein [Nonomuraea polychroma]RVX39116.1 hypothetical protein EDD27_1458 [Nonomuraea polychroma]
MWLGGKLAPSLQAVNGIPIVGQYNQRALERLAVEQPPPPPISPHLINPAQGTLFEAERDWSRLGPLQSLPSLTPAAQALPNGFRAHARAQGWRGEVSRASARTLRILAAWIGVQAPLREADVRALVSANPSQGIRAIRVVQFLAGRGQLVSDPARQINRDQRAIERVLKGLPGHIEAEARRWVLVLRGEGRHRHPTMSYATIRRYVSYLWPVLHRWSGQVASLREIVADDVRAVLGETQAHTARNRHTALRSLFRALKQERLIFRDPACRVSLPKVQVLPVPIPSDRLRGLVDRAHGPQARLVVALIAVHALGVGEVTHLRLADLDLSRGRLAMQRDTVRRTIYLDEYTHTLADAWLRERHRRWPTTTNPYLLINQMTAQNTQGPPVSRRFLHEVFRPVGPTPSKIRQDRLLDEARHTADPVHLMRVFGVTAGTAMRYVYAAHPQKRSSLPRK